MNPCCSRALPFEVTVPDIPQAILRLVRSGCKIVKDEPHIPRCYVADPFGLTYNIRQQA